jgi:hypothetical protein
MRKIQTKAQLGIGDAPTVVLLIGLTFLVMATIAFIGEKYGDSIDTDNVNGTIRNETKTTVNQAGDNLAVVNYKNVVCTATTVTNATDGFVISSGNYTLTSCNLKAVNGAANFNNTNWNISYTYLYSAATTASNVTGDLNTEIDNNTSIAGIVLTIALVGIVLTILIGVFLGIRRNKI